MRKAKRACSRICGSRVKEHRSAGGRNGLTHLLAFTIMLGYLLRVEAALRGGRVGKHTTAPHLRDAITEMAVRDWATDERRLDSVGRLACGWSQGVDCGIDSMCSAKHTAIGSTGSRSGQLTGIKVGAAGRRWATLSVDAVGTDELKRLVRHGVLSLRTALWPAEMARRLLQ